MILGMVVCLVCDIMLMVNDGRWIYIFDGCDVMGCVGIVVSS